MEKACFAGNFLDRTILLKLFPPDILHCIRVVYANLLTLL